MATKRPEPYSPEKKAAAEAVGERLVDLLKEEFFTLEGTPKLPVKFPDGKYDTKPLVAGWEYTLASTFVGARGYLVFQFSPEDAQEYSLVDFTAKQLDDFLPLFGPKMAEVLGYDDLDAAPAVLARAIHDHLTNAASHAEKASEEAAAAFAKIPNFGRFA